MNTKRFIFTVVGTFIFIYAFEAILHGYLLMDMYRQTPDLWRPEADMLAYFPFMLGRQFLLAVIFSGLFTLKYEAKGIGEGVRFGLIIGSIIGILQSGAYTYMPISLALAGMWLLGGILLGLGFGIVCALIYRN